MKLFKAYVPGFTDSPWSVTRANSPAGVFQLASAVQSVQATAQNGTSTGFAWIHVPHGATTSARIRRFTLKFNTSAATPTMPTLPRIGLSRFSIAPTDVASGTQLAALKTDSTNATAAVLDVRTAVTGLTPTLVSSGAFVAQGIVPPFILAGTPNDIALVNSDVQHLVGPDVPEDEWIVIPPDQGLVLWQADNGTTTDIRRFFFEMVWDEITG